MRKGMGFCTGCRKADELMEKKHKFKFNIGLNRNNPDHVRVAEILNRLGRGKAEYVVKAVLAYETGEGINTECAGGVDFLMLEEMIRKIVREQQDNENKFTLYQGSQLDQGITRGQGSNFDDDKKDILLALESFKN